MKIDLRSSNSMKLILVLALFASNACSSSKADGEGELEEAVAAEESEGETQKEESDESTEEAKLALVDAQATVAAQKAEDIGSEEAKAEEKEEVKEEKAAAEAAQQIVYPTTSLLNLRQGPGLSHSVARVAKFGEAISLSGESTGLWLKTSDGLWVSKGFVDTNKPARPNDPEIAKPAAAEELAANEVAAESDAKIEEAASAEAELEEAESTQE